MLSLYAGKDFLTKWGKKLLERMKWPPKEEINQEIRSRGWERDI